MATDGSVILLVRDCEGSQCRGMLDGNNNHPKQKIDGATAMVITIEE